MRAMSFLKSSLLIGLGGLLPGCFETLPPEAPDAVGGLRAEDFEQVSLNGLDPQENQIDLNDYAWSMEYFQPDGDAPAHVYVGTGNDLIGQVYSGFASMLTEEEAAQLSVGEPEIRRYREDIFRYAWETVLDYRDVETEPQPNRRRESPLRRHLRHAGCRLAQQHRRSRLLGGFLAARRAGLDSLYGGASRAAVRRAGR